MLALLASSIVCPHPVNSTKAIIFMEAGGKTLCRSKQHGEVSTAQKKQGGFAAALLHCLFLRSRLAYARW
jgi:hypothetical protein